jgi:Ca2+-binding RTX toxin-like protein
MSVSFNAANTFPVGITASSVVAADVDGDGILDLISGGTITPSGSVTQTGAISTSLGNSNGQFSSSPITSSGQGFGSATALAVGDFNGDRILDVITVGDVFVSTTSDVFVNLGNGRGGFRNSTTNLILTDNPQAVAVGDLNGDNRLDAVTAGGRTLSILLGDGTGNFNSPTSRVLNQNVRALTLKDFNNDGRLDIAAVTTANTANGNLVLLLGDGRGGFTEQPAISLGDTTYGASDIVTADFNGDGRLDVAALTGREISVLLGNGAGSFQLVFQTEQNANSLAAGDFNGDGRVDLATAAIGYDTNSTTILLGNGRGSFSRPVAFSTNDSFGSSKLTTGDFNKDNKLDLASVNSVVSINPTATDAVVQLNTTTEIDAIALGTTALDKKFVDASSEFSGAARIDLDKGTFVINGPTRLTKSVKNFDDAIGTVRDDRMRGNRRANLLNGFSGKDELLGFNGDDRIIGGANNDRMTGGRGKDDFIFTGTPNYPEGLETPFNRQVLGIDRITDFERGRDKIILDAGTFTALEAGQRIRFATVDDIAAAKTSRGIITYVRDLGRLYYNENGSRSGFGSGGQFAVLNDQPTLSARDFATFV